MNGGQSELPAELAPDLGVEALAARDYLGASRLFESARKRPIAEARRELLYLEIYTLCLADELDRARTLAAKAALRARGDPSDLAFDAFLAERFAW